MADYIRQRTNWIDFPDTSTKIRAVDLNGIEAGLVGSLQKSGGTMTGALLSNLSSDRAMDIGLVSGTDLQRGIVNANIHNGSFASFHRNITVEKAFDNATVFGEVYISGFTAANVVDYVGIRGLARSDVEGAAAGAANALAIGAWGTAYMGGGVSYGRAEGGTFEARMIVAATVTGAKITKGSAVITNISSTTGILTGMHVGDINNDSIPDNTTVVSVDSSTQITLSNPATNTVDNATLTACANDGILTGGEATAENYGSVVTTLGVGDRMKVAWWVGNRGIAPLTALIGSSNNNAQALVGVWMRHVTGDFFRAEFPDRPGANALAMVPKLFTRSVDMTATSAVITNVRFATRTGDTTNGSAVLANMNSTSKLLRGMVVTGTGIPASTTILSVDSSTQVTLSANATATNTGVALTILSTLALRSGMRVSGSGIPANTFISTVDSISQITLNRAALATLSSSSIRITNWSAGVTMPIDVALRGLGNDGTNRTGNTTAGSAVITGIAPNTTGITVGQTVRGLPIPEGAVVNSVDSSSQITLSDTALSTLTGTGIQLVATGFDLIRLDSTQVAIGDPTCTGILVPNNVNINGRSADGTTQYSIGRVDTTNTVVVGDTGQELRFAATALRILGAAGPKVTTSTGTPEAAVTAPVGSLNMRTDGATATTLYEKDSGAGNTGWVRVGTRRALVSKTANYTATIDDDVVLADATGGTFTVTLPTAVGFTGLIFTVKRINSGGNAVTVGTTSSQTIDGSTTQSLASQWDSLTMISDGSNWQIVTTRPAALGL